MRIPIKFRAALASLDHWKRRKESLEDELARLTREKEEVDVGYKRATELFYELAAGCEYRVGNAKTLGEMCANAGNENGFCVVAFCPLTKEKLY